ncbi:hypothetical protein MML48_4g00002710 [Holotrichia oblita]|uniref:Uncharacterized protein n=1 Tax=Holotrichia oblita TaxID=644536 RepID=A0ACB9T827_HOLOL|nr:hypothetical protein MML48_4g00002710 [Holotrichia oblita]
MANWSYEIEQKELQRLFEEVQTDSEVAEDSDSSLENDDIEIQEENSDTEQDLTDNEINDIVEPELQSKKLRVPYMFGKDGFKWKKHFDGRPNVRTRAHNIVTQMPGVKGEAKKKKTPIDIWIAVTP